MTSFICWIEPVLWISVRLYCRNMYKVTPQPHPLTVATCTIHQSTGTRSINCSLILFESYEENLFYGLLVHVGPLSSLRSDETCNCISLELNFLPLNMWPTPLSSTPDYMFPNINFWAISKLDCLRKHFTDSLLQGYYYWSHIQFIFTKMGRGALYFASKSIFVLLVVCLHVEGDND